MEWACIDALKPHLQEGEGSLGVAIDVNHVAATPPGMKVTVHVTCTKIDNRRVSFQVRAEDEIELIGEGTHDRAIVRWDRFLPKVAEKTGLSMEEINEAMMVGCLVLVFGFGSSSALAAARPSTAMRSTQPARGSASRARDGPRQRRARAVSATVEPVHEDPHEWLLPELGPEEPASVPASGPLTPVTSHPMCKKLLRCGILNKNRPQRPYYMRK